MSQIMPPPVPGMPPQYWPVPDRTESNTPAQLALVFGLSTLLLSVLASVPAIICGIMGIIKAGNPRVGRGKGMAIAGTVLAVVVPAIQFVVFVYPVLVKAQERASLEQSMSNLRQISAAVRIYDAENKGHLPPDLQSTYMYVKAPKVYHHPANQRPMPNPKNLDAESDYVYVYARKTDPATGEAYLLSRLPSRYILLHEKAEFARDGQILAVWRDGEVRRMRLVEFKAQMAEQQATEAKP
ncbi:MAG: DUF4190 domain-containing protein [Tepidisphaerales bacterium]